MNHANFRKRPGECLCCQASVYQVNYTDERTGHVSLGPMLDEGTQVELMLSDGSCVHLDCCVECAAALKPEDYHAMWEAVIQRTDERCQQWKRSANERQRAILGLTRVFPIAVLRWRRQAPATGALVVDRRFQGVVHA